MRQVLRLLRVTTHIAAVLACPCAPARKLLTLMAGALSSSAKSSGMPLA